LDWAIAPYGEDAKMAMSKARSIRLPPVSWRPNRRMCSYAYS
jgi:hypothetical protein